MKKIKNYVQLIENTLARQDWDREPAQLYEPVSYILHLGGKRLRPALTLAACELFNGPVEEALMPAMAVEVFHNFSLVHDDIMDAAPLRRGQPTVHHKWDLNTGILSGDAMLVKAYQYVAMVEPAILPSVMRVFSQTALEVCEGQQYDMNFENLPEVAEEDYLEMIRLKTSVLLGCALKLGALVANARPQQADDLYQFGVHIGIAFQIQDDILDAFGDPEKFGKQNGGDILQDKKTLLMIHALQKAPEIEELLGTAADPQKKVEAVKKVFENSGALHHARKTMQDYFDQAIQYLEKAGGNPEIQGELKAFANYLIIRDN